MAVPQWTCPSHLFNLQTERCQPECDVIPRSEFWARNAASVQSKPFLVDDAESAIFMRWEARSDTLNKQNLAIANIYEYVDSCIKITAINIVKIYSHSGCSLRMTYAKIISPLFLSFSQQGTALDISRCFEDRTIRNKSVWLLILLNTDIMAWGFLQE